MLSLSIFNVLGADKSIELVSANARIGAWKAHGAAQMGYAAMPHEKNRVASVR